MFLVVTIKKRKLIFIVLFMMVAIICMTVFFWPSGVAAIFAEKEISEEVQYIFDKRNQALLDQDIKTLQGLYDQDIRYGVWAYEHEMKKMKYLHKWSEKQGVKFNEISSNAMVKWVKQKGEGYVVNLTVSTTYKYAYENTPEETNMFRIGTYHSLDLKKIDERWIITREWYTDPFADSLHLDEIKTEEIKEYIQSKEPMDFSNMIERRQEAVAYGDRYCGAAGDLDYKYNKKYRNYNPLGGDCANFASQMLYEGGKFRKNYTWNYDKGASKAWVNAQAFKNYMVYSGRASVIAHGSYDKVYKAAYKLEPGDFVAYEKKGKVTHISVATGADSKGYPLVNSHNSDRYRVPWDLGWSDKNIKYWLVHVHF